MSKELEALNTYLTALIKQREGIRRDYIMQDKELGKEIMEILERIRETETGVKAKGRREEEFVDQTGEAETAAAAATEIAPDEEEVVHTSRKSRARFDYPGDVVPKAIALLREAENGLTGKELLVLLKEKFGFEFSNATIALNRILSFTNRIKKENRNYYYNSEELL